MYVQVSVAFAFTASKMPISGKTAKSHAAGSQHGCHELCRRLSNTPIVARPRYPVPPVTNTSISVESASGYQRIPYVIIKVALA
jgi:hypothetical protein